MLYRLNTLGYRIGQKLLELHTWRTEGTSKQPKREVRFLPALSALGGPIWKAAFGKAADQIQKSMEKDDECECGAAQAWRACQGIDTNPPLQSCSSKTTRLSRNSSPSPEI